MAARQYGDVRRWLINKAADGTGWLLHEPITRDALSATPLPTFEAACAAFAAFTKTHAAPVADRQETPTHE